MNIRAIAAALALAGAATAAGAGEAAGTTDTSAADAAAATPRLAYGLMMQQGDKLVFAPCRDRSYALLEDVSGDGTVLRGLQLAGLGAGKKLYVELLAVTDGLALKASGFNLARADGRCQQPGGADEAWQAAGHDPGWLLAAGGEQVLLRRAGTADLVLPYREFSRDGGAATYAGEADGHRLALRLEPALCQDAAAGTVFGWTAALSVDGAAYQGCAWQR